MPAVTRSQARKQRLAELLAASTPNLTASASAPSLGSPVQLKQAVPTSTTARELRRALTRVMSQTSVAPMPAPSTSNAAGPSLPQIQPPLMAKPLQRYVTPLHLIGKGLDNPDLLNAPRGKKIFQVPPNITEEAEAEDRGGDTEPETGSSMQDHFPDTTEWRFEPDEMELFRDIEILSGWLETTPEQPSLMTQEEWDRFFVAFEQGNITLEPVI